MCNRSLHCVTLFHAIHIGGFLGVVAGKGADEGVLSPGVKAAGGVQPLYPSVRPVSPFPYPPFPSLRPGPGSSSPLVIGAAPSVMLKLCKLGTTFPVSAASSAVSSSLMQILASCPHHVHQRTHGSDLSSSSPENSTISSHVKKVA
ncbi:hypothetical protein E2C01_015499 [Portunus trituberculatus]|uniref:Uncharacterized protein n=1 Tax=Portunus trituberculatus TaxID=210409 RepID=A0A5B7DN60_PORTR|nr:hypothetical protein [Portunus trituberculatus]